MRRGGRTRPLRAPPRRRRPTSRRWSALEHVYAGDHGGEASIGAITLLDGSSLGHWAYRPAPVFPGRHTAHVTLTVNDQAPPGHFTNQMEATIYAPKAGTVARAVFPFEKEWLLDADRARGG